jgi:nucleotide-binding universal stress UspA family protein
MSNTSRQALRVAAEEARIRAAGLHAVHAVHWDSVGGEWITPTTEQLVEWGQKLVEAELVRTDVAARTVIIHGKPRDVLVRHSAHADLLVLGARGRGSLAAMLLGSVSDYCAQHAHCPVMIVHPKEEVEAGPDSTPDSTISAR